MKVFFALALLVSAYSFIAAQSPAAPAPIDLKQMEAAKQAYLKEHPEEAKQHAGISYFDPAPAPVQKLEVTREALNNAPAEKRAHILAHPEMYTVVDQLTKVPAPEATAGQGNELHTVSKSDFNSMPAERQQHILAHPERYKISE